VIQSRKWDKLAFMNISTVIPIYIEDIFQIELLNRALDSILEQTILPIEVIITDNSTKGELTKNIKEVINNKALNIKYFTNIDTLGAAKNTNFSVGKANADLIHILHQDDFIISKQLYENVVEVFSKNGKIWLIAQGKVGERILESKFDLTTKFGFNELGGPSSLFVLRENYIYANPNYRMLFDVINYHEYFLKFGNPHILQGTNIQFSVHEYQLSNKITSREVLTELYNFIKEYKIPKTEIKIAIKSIKREIHHQRLLLLASLFRKKISICFFIVNISISYTKSLKRKVFN
jgi:glycosyltransferase involved in cell wall biosynthesis